jgi:glutamyl-tRNA reductase
MPLMDLMLAGISHKTAPLEVRERFAISERRVPEALRRLQAEPDIEEALILSTCNRVEFVLKVRRGHDGREALRRFGGSFYGLQYDEFASCSYVYEDFDALRHLFRVASGLDSMVVGEPQVLGQVKRAYALAKEAEAVGGVLGAVFHRVFNVAKRVRTETHVAEAPVSVSSAAVDLAERVLGDLQGKTVMIVGAGQMGELAARHFVSKGAATVLVSNRTYAHALALAEELHGRAIRFDSIWQAMKQTDIVITSTGCPHCIISRQDMEKLMDERGHRPLFLVDIAVPRDIEPTVGELPGCTLANVDSLQEVARENLRQREEAVAAAELILAEEIAQFRERQEALQVVPTIVSLRRRMEEIRRSELARTRDLFGALTPEQEEVLETVSQGLVNKILHTPFTELRQAVARPDRSEFLDLVRSVFRLEEEPASSALVAN